MWLIALIWYLMVVVTCEDITTPRDKNIPNYEEFLRNIRDSSILQRYDIDDLENAIIERKEYYEKAKKSDDIDYGSLNSNDGTFMIPRGLTQWHDHSNDHLEVSADNTTTCTTEICRQFANDVKNNINFDADPCTDFDEFACGGWRKLSPIPETSTEITVFTKLWRDQEKTLRNLIEKQRDAPENSSALLVYNWYSSCMNHSKTNKKHGVTPLLNILEFFGSSSLLSPFWELTNWSMVNSLVKMNSVALFPFIVVLPSMDLFNTSKNIIQLGLPELPLGSAKFYLGRDKYYNAVRNSYLKMMLKLWLKLSPVVNNNAFIWDIANIYKLEHILAKISLVKDLGYRRMRLIELEKIVPQFPWRQYLSKLYEGVPQKKKITGNELIGVDNLNAIKKLVRLLNLISSRTKANYMTWIAIHSFFVHFGEDYENLYKDFTNVMYGKHKRKEKWRECVFSTSNALGMGLGKLFVEERFNEDKKEKAAKIIEMLRKELIDNFDQLSWMDKETARKATEKAEAIVKNIGYPSFILNETSIRIFYKGLVFDEEDFFQNAIVRRLRVVNNTLQCRETKPDRSSWSMSPQQINAYYSQQYNKIVFPAGILQSPFWHSDIPMSLQFGGFGFIAGHEITHGFDQEGMRYDKYGNLHNWWSNNSMIAYVNKSRCLAKQYSQYTIFGTNINGNVTLCENIADNGGLRLAHKAYKAWLQNNGTDQRLPWLPFNNEQLFFLKSAQAWCANIRKNSALSILNIDGHTPKMFRTIGILSNNKEFAKAFKCPSDSRMNPNKKCLLW